MPPAIVAVLGCLLLISPVQSASFDCGKARTRIENLICADAELSKLDEDLNVAYRQSITRNDVRREAIKTQREWLKNERNVCESTACVKAAYQRRIQELQMTSSFGITFSRPARDKSSRETTKKALDPKSGR
jgi:uncharacterized protein